MMDLSKAPEKGIMYALYRDKMVYQKYNSLAEVKVDEDRLLELHLFDKKEEYRFIKSRKKEIKALISDETISYEDIYPEIIFTEDGGKVKVINYISYDENDLLMIQNYRLAEV